MPVPIRAIIGVVAIVVAVAGTAFILRQPAGVAAPMPTASPSPSSPTPSPSAAAESTDPATWARYTSAQHGFTIGYPPGWTLRKAFRPWSLEEDQTDSMLSPGADGFLSADELLYVNGWSAPLSPGQSSDEWLAAYCPLTCAAAFASARPITVDGRPGSLATLESDSQAFVFTEDRVFVFGVWRDSSEPLLEDFLSTVDLP